MRTKIFPLIFLILFVFGIIWVINFTEDYVYVLEDDNGFDTPVEDFQSLDIDPDIIVSLDVEKIVTTFFKKYRNDYDFLAVFPSFSPNKEMEDFAANSWFMQNNVRGICETISSECYWGQCGSERIKAVELFTYGANDYNILVDFPEVIGQLLLHEIGHTWGANLGNQEAVTPLPDGINEGCTKRTIPLVNKDDNHWSEGLQIPLDDGLGIIGEMKPWVDRGEGIYTYDIDYSDNPSRYHPFDLYLMGLISPSEIKQDFLLLTDVESYFDLLPDGSQLSGREVAVKANAMKVSIDDVIKIAGEERNPNAQNSQKDFKIAFVVITKKGQKPSDNMLKTIKEAAKLFPGQWAVATGNRASMNK